MPTPGKSHGGLGLVALAAEVDDDALAERRVLDVVADAQPEVVGVARCRRVAAAGGEGSVDDTLAVGVAASLGLVGVDAAPRPAAVRRRLAPSAPAGPQALAAVGAAAGDVALLASTSSAGISSRNRDGGLYCVRAEQAAAPGVGDVQHARGPG